MMLTKAQLQNERKIQQLQMQAINALWKKVSTMQGVDQRAGGEPSNCTTAEDAIGASDGSQSAVSQAQGQLCLDQNSTAVVNDLAKRCTMLTDQVQQLQSSIGTIVNCLTMVCNLPQDALKKQINSSSDPEESEGSNATEPRDSSATQTDLIAVHTPQLEDLSNFPFTKPRPSTLALESKHDALDASKIQTDQQQQQQLAETEHDDEQKENIAICDAPEDQQQQEQEQ